MVELKTISAVLPVKVLKTLDAIAAEKKRQFGDIINEAVLLYVNEWEEYKRAIHRLNDHKDPILSEKEFLNELKEDLGWKV